MRRLCAAGEREPMAVARIPAEREIHNGGRSASAAGVSAAGNCQAHPGGIRPAPTRNCGRPCPCSESRSKNGEQKRKVMRPGTAASSSTVHKDTPSDREATECWFVRHLLFRPPSLAVLQHSESLNRLGFVPHARLSRLPAPRAERRACMRVIQDMSFFIFIIKKGGRRSSSVMSNSDGGQ